MSKIKLSSNASGTGNVTVISPATNSDRTITLPDGDGAMPLMRLETAKTATGTSVDFTGIPAWTKRITVMFSGVSTNGTSLPQIQLGDAGGVENTGYAGTSANIKSGIALQQMSAGFTLVGAGNWLAASVAQGGVTISNISGNTWAAFGMLGNSADTVVYFTAGSKTLSDTLTQIRITTVNGADVFDAGTINIMYEG
jgi:hypothetical protein